MNVYGKQDMDAVFVLKKFSKDSITVISGWVKKKKKQMYVLAKSTFAQGLKEKVVSNATRHIRRLQK